MLQVDSNGTIKLTRGDTAKLAVKIENDILGEDYEMRPDDKLTMTVKKSVKDEAFIFQKVIKGITNFVIDPIDTEKAGFGVYKYDVELTTEEGEVYTIIPPSNFEIMTEVTY